MTYLRDNGLDWRAIDAEALLEAFLEAMDAGLRGEPDALPMLPAAFLLTDRPLRDVEVPTFDVGGTNTRSARVRFDAEGRPSVLGLRKGGMPGSRGAVSLEAFYAQLLEVLTPNIRPGESLGYCFSYPVDLQGRLLFWTKGIQADSVVGSNVVAGLADALEANGRPGCVVRVLNDTVATLLAAQAMPGSEACAGLVGFILGTGSNTAYAERTERVPKCPGLAPGAYVPINCESGNFAHFPRSRFDEEYEAASGNGRGLWERTLSGVNLGALGTIVLRDAARDGILRGRRGAAAQTQADPNSALDDFGAGRTPDVFPCADAQEAETVRALLRPLYERAAVFAAIDIAAAALASARARGRDKGLIRVNADGSTFWKTACVPFVSMVGRTLDALLAPRGFAHEIVRVEDAPLIGAALAAMR